MKLILIDPKAREVTEVDYDDNWENISRIIDCDTFDCARAREYDMFIDDNGLWTEEPHFFLSKGFPTPICGRALVHAIDGEGNTVPAEGWDVEKIREDIVWVNDLMKIAGIVIAIDDQGQHHRVYA